MKVWWVCRQNYIGSCGGFHWGGSGLLLFIHDVSHESFHGLQLGVQAIAETTVQGNDNLHFVAEYGCWVELYVLYFGLHTDTIPDTVTQTLLLLGLGDADHDSQEQKHFDEGGHCCFQDDTGAENVQQR